jgi:general nucleoside transport system permease protein
MNDKKPSWYNIGFQVIGIFLAFLFTILILILSGSSPLETFRQIALGSFGSVKKIADVMVITIPLTIITSGLLITFLAGLWNIGIEGQITLGAIFTTWIMRLLQDTPGPPAMIILVSVLAGMVGGCLWALLVGLLRVFGGVNEIFGGLGLNFVATALTLWLIFGPWKRPGIGSMSGTVPFPEGLWLGTIPGYRLSIWGLVLAFSAFLAVYFLLRDTIIGLRLKAIGKNLRAAYQVGIPAWQHMILAFLLCGLLAGLAGSLQVVGFHHRLVPSISGGYGFTALLIAMLISYRAFYIIPIAIFFAALNLGSIQLPIVLKMDSSLAGVLQGTLVLFVIIMEGIRLRITTKIGRKQLEQ